MLFLFTGTVREYIDSRFGGAHRHQRYRPLLQSHREVEWCTSSCQASGALGEIERVRALQAYVREIPTSIYGRIDIPG